MFLFPPLLLRAQWDQNGITGDRHERQEIKGPLMFSPASVCVCVCVCVWVSERKRERERRWERQEDGRASENIYFLFWLSVALVTFSWEAFELSTLFEPSRTKVGMTVDNTLSFSRSLCLRLYLLSFDKRVIRWPFPEPFFGKLGKLWKFFVFFCSCLFWTLTKKRTPDTKAGRQEGIKKAS